MASFIRLGAIRMVNTNLIKPISVKNSSSLLSCLRIRCINTSSKPSNATSTTTETSVVNQRTKALNQTQENESENWISYGMCEDDKWLDRFAMHTTFFMIISVCLVFGGTWIAYMPDLKEAEWTQREAYLQLRYREENGLPLVDPNYVDPSKLNLPTDEELGDTPIII